MNVYDKAHELSRALKNSPEVIEYKKALQNVNKEEKSKKMLDDFRKLQFQAYSEQMEKGDLLLETKEKIEKISSVISLNPEINSFMHAEMKFGVIWEDIMKILNEAIDLEGK